MRIYRVKLLVLYMVERHLVHELLELIEYFPVTGIIGPRQVGKTTLSQNLSSKINKEIIYLDLENPKDQVQLEDPVLFFEQHVNRCVILDEIHMPCQFVQSNHHLQMAHQQLCSHYKVLQNTPIPQAVENVWYVAQKMI